MAKINSLVGLFQEFRNEVSRSGNDKAMKKDEWLLFSAAKC